MSRRMRGAVLEYLRRSVPPPLLPAARRPLAAAIVIGCVALTVLLGACFTGQRQADWLDTAVDARIQASLRGHQAIMNSVASAGNPHSVTVMTAVLLLACLVTWRWRGAALVAVAVPAATATTEFLLKPLIDRTLQGGLSFPSGHTTGVFAVAVAFAVLLVAPPRPRLPAAARLVLAVAALLAAGVVAVALVDLGFHYFTDTVAGAAVSTSVVLAAALILDRLTPPRRWPLHQRQHPPPPVRRAETPAARLRPTRSPRRSRAHTLAASGQHERRGWP